MRTVDEIEADYALALNRRFNAVHAPARTLRELIAVEDELMAASKHIEDLKVEMRARLISDAQQ